jgi:hypothetical protein
VVTVHPLPPRATAEDRLKAFASTRSDYTGPAKARFLKSRDVSLQTLQNEQRDSERVAARVDIFFFLDQVQH